jgi:hypothetical protein
MENETSWQESILEELSTLLRGKKGVRALIMTGSLADPGVRVDEWSDIDLKVILSDDSLPDYDSSPDWLSPVGDVIGFQCIRHGSVTTFRVCLEKLRRLDITLIPESMFAGGADWKFNPFQGEFRVFWSDVPGLDRAITGIPDLPPAPVLVPGELSRITDEFWFTAAVALSKVVRNDLLVALHLAFALGRKCLELQMILRDRELGTNVHREGGWGNDIVGRLSTKDRNWSAEEIVNFIAAACRLFDELAQKLNPGYRPRHDKVSAAIERANKSAGRGLAPPENRD